MDKLIELIDNTRKTAFGSADFRIINFNDIKNVLAFAAKSCAEQLRKIMNTDIIKNYLKG